MQIVSGKHHPTLSAYPIADGESQAHYVGGLLENAKRLRVNIDIVLMDRGFYAVDVILEVVEQGAYYIVPLLAVKNYTIL